MKRPISQEEASNPGGAVGCISAGVILLIIEIFLQAQIWTCFMGEKIFPGCIVTLETKIIFSVIFGFMFGVTGALFLICGIRNRCKDDDCDSVSCSDCCDCCEGERKEEEMEFRVY
mmetsp:Transcript_38235/g.75122  ORF Transcript_38235/g.75122 Transcript_38235/m.75122 type:complete len:116 (+) Transcript_38235:118-465(+)